MEMFIENRSKYGRDCGKITNAVLAASWKVPHIHDLMETSGKASEVFPVVLKCKPSLSYRILSKDSERIFHP